LDNTSARFCFYGFAFTSPIGRKEKTFDDAPAGMIQLICIYTNLQVQKTPHPHHASSTCCCFKSHASLCVLFYASLLFQKSRQIMHVRAFVSRRRRHNPHPPRRADTPAHAPKSHACNPPPAIPAPAHLPASLLADCCLKSVIFVCCW
jgi:hypothetical protein